MLHFPAPHTVVHKSSFGEPRLSAHSSALLTATASVINIVLGIKPLNSLEFLITVFFLKTSRVLVTAGRSAVGSVLGDFMVCL